MMLVSPATLEQQLVLIEAMVIKAEAAATVAHQAVMFTTDQERMMASRNAAEACKAAAEARLVLLKAQVLYLQAVGIPKGE